MSNGLTFTVDPDGRAAKFLERAAAAIKDFKPPLRETEKFQGETIKKQFSSQGSEILGGKWKARKQPTGGWPVLKKSGKLKGSFKKTKLTKSELNVTSKTPYYKYHQTGTKKMPQRQILGHSDKMIEKTLDIFIKYINRKIQSG